MELDNSRLLNLIMLVVSRRSRKNDFFPLLILACAVVVATLLFRNPMSLVAAEVTGIEALLELEPLDWDSINPPKVIDECTLALANKPKLKEDQVCRLYLLRGKALLMVGKEEAALRDLTELLTIRPNDCLALCFRGEVYSTLRKYDKAQTDFETLVKLQPKSGIGYAWLSLCLGERGHNDDSKNFAEKAISLAPDEARGYLARAEARLRNDKYLEGLKDLNRCMSLSYGSGTIVAARPFLLRTAVFMHIFDNPKKALPDLLMARGLDRYSEDTKNLFCEYYFKTGKYNLAFRLSEQLPKGQMYRLTSLPVKVGCLIERNRHKEALEAADSMVREVPQWWGSYLCRGEVSFSQKKYKDALQDYDRVLSLRHDNIGTMAAKAYLLATCPEAQFRDGPLARTLASKCCEITEYQVPRHIMLLAMACAECGDYKEAVRLAKESLKKADSSFPYLADYKRRLALFEAEKPYRFVPGSRTFDYLFP
jgi:tetratricopeptide (TPR) repeat protein